MQKKIAHIDMDAFYVSVEIRDNPSLQGKPVAVGGSSDRRGVLSTCNYIARKFGVSSAMPTAIAKQKCPHLIVVPGRMKVYSEVSKQIRHIFNQYTDKVEPLSLDEAYLDLSQCELLQGSATRVAQQIRQDIYTTTRLTASAGIAPVKFLAKIASDVNKPNGQFTIAPEQVDNFIQSMDLNKIPGVGKVTTERLNLLGFRTGADILASNESFLVSHFGKFGSVLWERCKGLDPREVEVSRIRKSVGVERTFSQDVSNSRELETILREKLIPELKERARAHLQSREMNRLGVKVKFHDFQITTKDQKYNEINTEILLSLLNEALVRGKGKSVRLLGVHIGFANDTDAFKQLSLDFEKRFK